MCVDVLATPFANALKDFGLSFLGHQSGIAVVKEEDDQDQL